MGRLSERKVTGPDVNSANRDRKKADHFFIFAAS
jgi:hypothetical protein